ncbi:MAG: hypothetical protein Q8R01_01155 [Ramlibacter sp.]|nr:hypothetical protein [Ramlibacter sp.]
MKSLTQSGLRAIAHSQFEISLLIQGVLRDVQHAFVGRCVHAGKRFPAAMMEADCAALCCPKGVPDTGRRAMRGGTEHSSATCSSAVSRRFVALSQQHLTTGCGASSTRWTCRW